MINQWTRSGVPTLALSFGMAFASLSSAQTLDSSWVFTANGQSAQYVPGKGVVISNINSPDNFGPAGPGSPPDFVGDEFVQIIGTRVADGEVLYAFSEPFIISQNLTYTVPGLTITPVPPPFPLNIHLSLSSRVLAGVGAVATSTVIGTLGGELEPVDLTEKENWTLYKTSNPAIVAVTENGILVAKGVGTAFITATNLGATSVAKVVVPAGFLSTDVEGYVLSDGGRAQNAQVELVGLGLVTTADSTGRFFFPGVSVPKLPGSTPQLQAYATWSAGGAVLTGTSSLTGVAPGLTTDLGFISVLDQSGLTNPGFELGSFSGWIAAGNATIVNQVGQIASPEGSFMASVSTAPVGVFGGVALDGLVVPAGATALEFDLNFLSGETDLPESFNDTFVVTVACPPIGAKQVYSFSRSDLYGSGSPPLTGPPGFAHMSGFRTVQIALGEFTSSGAPLRVDFAVFDVGGDVGTSTVLLDAFRFQ